MKRLRVEKVERTFFSSVPAVTEWNNLKQRREQGIILAEVIVALFLSLAILLSLLPIWHVVQEKRMNQKQLSLAIDLIQNEAELFRAEQTITSSRRDVWFHGHHFVVLWQVEKAERWEKGRVNVQWYRPGGKEVWESLSMAVYRTRGESP